MILGFLYPTEVIEEVQLCMLANIVWELNFLLFYILKAK